ncbi:cytochrome P450 [Amycolatopsis lurida]
MTDTSDLSTISGPIPTVPGALPLLGHLPQLLRDPLGFFASLPAHGDLVAVRIGRAEAVVVCDPGLVREILQNDQIFDKGGFFFDRVRAESFELLRAEGSSDGLFTVTHSGGHRSQRRLLQPAFRAGRIPRYGQSMTDEIVSVTDEWRDGQSLDVFVEMSTITSNVLAATVLSDALTPVKRRQAIADVVTVTGEIYRRMLLPSLLNRLPTPGNRRFRRASDRLLQYMGGVIADRRTSDIDHGDLLSVLLATRDSEDGDRGLSDADILQQVVTFFGAGMETTAATLAWAWWLLAQHPEIEEALHAEVDAVLAGRTAEHSDIPQLALTGRIITETLRLWPPAWMFPRRTTVDTRLGGYPLLEGTTIVYSPYLVHRRADLYEEPDRFDPDRWLPERVAPRDALIPFGGGARKCIGHNFAFTEAVLALATIASRWRLQAPPGHRMKPKLGVVLIPQGLQLTATRRRSHER